MATTVPVSAGTRSGARGVLARVRGTVGEIARRPTGLLGLVVVVGLLLVALLAPVIAPDDPAAQDVTKRLEGSSSAHLLGTDQLGRDILSRVIHGTRIAFEVSLPAVLIALLIGLALGLTAGYAGRWVDNTLVVVMDTIQSFPGLILALAIIALVGPSMVNLIAILALTFVPSYARVTRALVLAVKENQFVEAERALGARDLRIAMRHVLPNVIGPLFIMLSMDIPTVITAEAGLSFLGLGVQPPNPSWGVVLNDGFARVEDSPWGIIGGGMALMIATLGFTFLGETLRSVFDPKIVGRRWRRG
jgi:peptide/nickel transport system permease protein